MTSNPTSAVWHTAKQAVAVIVASYLGAIFGLGLYTTFQMYGFRFQEVAGDKSIFFFSGGIVVPVASVFASVLVSCYAPHFQVSKLGILLSLIGSYFGVYIELLLLDAIGGWVGSLWPAIVGCYSFLGYEAGLIVGRRWLSPKHVPKGAR